MNTLLQVQILVCRDNDGIVAGSANDRAGGEEVDQGHGNPHTHPQQCHTVQGHPTHYFLVDLFIFFNAAYLLTLSSSALTTVQSTAVLWCFNGTSPPSSSLQQSATRRWKVLLLYCYFWCSGQLHLTFPSGVLIVRQNTAVLSFSRCFLLPSGYLTSSTGQALLPLSAALLLLTL